MITRGKRSEMIGLYGQLKSLRKTTFQESVSKDTVIRVLKNRNRKTGKKTGCPEALSILDKNRTRRMTRHLLREDELVTSRIIKKKACVTASRRTICQALAKQGFRY